MEIKEKIEKKCNLLIDYLHELDIVLPEEEKDYYANILYKNASERLVEKITDVSTDIVALLCKVHDSPSTTILDFSTMVRSLENKQILTKKMANEMIELYGFKNRILFNYGAQEQTAAYEILTGEFFPFFQDFAEFVAEKILPTLNL